MRRKSLTRAALFDPSLPGDLIDELWREPASLVASGEIMRRTSLRRTVRIDWGGKSYVLKQYRPTWWHFARQLPRTSWASATFEAAMKLIDAGIPTPRPLACIENRWGILRRDSFLMYEYVEGVTLFSHLERNAKGTHPLADNFLRQICELWQRLIDLRASLNDSHFGNFILAPGGRLWLIDLDKTRFHRTAFMAARRHQRDWQQIKRSAARCGTTVAIPMPAAQIQKRNAA